MSTQDRPYGDLYLVGTPIGNLDDMTPRAHASLDAADLVAAEDTRRTLRLLNHLGLKKRLVSYHEHNHREQDQYLLDKLRSGQSVALVSDAGTPCISDPGNDLVDLCLSAGIRIIPIPGSCAAVVSLSASGLSPGRFAFEGFLPAKGRERKSRISQLSDEPRTMVFYEAPHRLRKTLSDLLAAGFGQRLLSIGRELTKLHEEIVRMTLEETVARYEARDPRGEYVLVMEGRDAFASRLPDAAGELEDGRSESDLVKLLETLRGQDLSLKDAVRVCMESTGRKRNDIYPVALRIWQEK